MRRALAGSDVWASRARRRDELHERAPRVDVHDVRSVVRGSGEARGGGREAVSRGDRWVSHRERAIVRADRVVAELGGWERRVLFVSPKCINNEKITFTAREPRVYKNKKTTLRTLGAGAFSRPTASICASQEDDARATTGSSAPQFTRVRRSDPTARRDEIFNPSRKSPLLAREAVRELLRAPARAAVLVHGDVPRRRFARGRAAAVVTALVLAFAVLRARAFRLGRAAAEAVVLGREDEPAPGGAVPVPGPRRGAASGAVVVPVPAAGAAAAPAAAAAVAVVAAALVVSAAALTMGGRKGEREERRRRRSVRSGGS